MVEIDTPVQRRCPLCGDSAFAQLKRFSNGVVVGRCSCGLIYTPVQHPQPYGLLLGATTDGVEKLYAPIVAGRSRHFRMRNFADYLEKIRRWVATGRLLDVGCAHGFFGRAALDAGFKVSGVEPSPTFAAFARKHIGLEVMEGRLEDVDLRDERWDVIAFTDSFEYLPEPKAALKKLKDHFREAGVLFIKVPNGAYFSFWNRLDAALGRERDSGPFSPAMRTIHYTEATMARLLATAQYDVLELGYCRPIHSANWGGHQEIESPWYVGWGSKMARVLMHASGRIESLILRGQNHFSQALYVIARPKR